MSRRSIETGMVYQVFLADTEDLPWVDSPITVDEIEFDDFGAWLSRDGAAGRDFYPYHQLRLVRERPESNVEEDEDTAEL